MVISLRGRALALMHALRVTSRGHGPRRVVKVRHVVQDPRRSVKVRGVGLHRRRAVMGRHVVHDPRRSVRVTSRGHALRRAGMVHRVDHGLRCSVMVTSADLHRRHAVQMVSMREVAMMRCADAVTMRGVDMQVAVTGGSMRR